MLAAGALCLPLLAQADETDVELTATVVKNTCSIALDNNAVIDLGSREISDFTTYIDPETPGSGGRSFYIRVENCEDAKGLNPTKLVVRFRPLLGQLAPGTTQIFPNEEANGPKNIGIAIFSLQNPDNPQNVLDANGQPRSVYPWNPAAVNNQSYPFYTRMHRISAVAPVTAGPVNTRVWVEAYYE